MCILHNYYIIFSMFWEDSPIIQIVFIFYSHFIAILTLQSSKRKDADKICFFILMCSFLHSYYIFNTVSTVEFLWSGYHRRVALQPTWLHSSGTHRAAILSGACSGVYDRLPHMPRRALPPHFLPASFCHHFRRQCAVERRVPLRGNFRLQRCQNVTGSWC